MRLLLKWAPISPIEERKEARKQQSRIAYGLLDAMLQAEGLSSYRTEKDTAGRPYIANHPELDCSIAHTNTLAVCALAVGGAGEASPRVGVDAEPCHSVTQEKARSLAARFFAPSEQEALRLCRSEEVPARFLEIFTQKEAYAKFVGTGLAKTLAVDTLDLAFTPKTGLYFHHLQECDHHITLCLPTKNLTLEFCS